MKILKLVFFTVVYWLALLSCIEKSSNQDTSFSNILPSPEKLKSSGKFASIDKIIVPQNNEAITQFLPWLTTWAMPVQMATEGEVHTLSINTNSELKPGAYKLLIQEKSIEIQHKNKEGLRNALSTIQQLLVFNNQKLPMLEIEDQAAFQYRGMHLDVARHFFKVEEIKQYIDYLAFYKLNYFHWHLTDDQGWRIEIKKYPKLQEIAAYRNETLIGHYNDEPHQFDGKKYGGYYTQEQIKDIVAYASARGIEVMPEIDIPGHSTAILAAYPELGCLDKKYETATKWGIFFDILCPKPETFDFLEGVFDEVIELFPSQYIHVGGDECPKNQWKNSDFCQKFMKQNGLKDENELQSYFIQYIENYINKKGRKLVGWEEILEGGLAPNATVVSWTGNEGGIKSAKLHHPAIMAPSTHCYFDYYQSENPSEPLAIGGFIPYEKVYNWSPIPEELPDSLHQYIIGGEGTVWTEYIKDFSKVEYMGFTRIATLAEVLWGKNSRDINQFTKQLFKHILYWKGEKVNMANHLLDVQTLVENENGQGVSVNLNTPLEGTTPTVITPSGKKITELEKAPFELKEKGSYEFYAELGKEKGRSKHLDFNPHIGNKAKVSLKEQAAEKYSGNGPQSVFNGIQGNSERYGGAEWLGFEGKDFNAMLTFEEPQHIKNIHCRFFKGEGQWIYLPSKVEIYSVQTNGEQKLIASTNDIDTETKIANVSLAFDEIKVQKLNIVVKNFGLIPEGKQGGGHKSWLFVDEFVIN